MSGPDEPRAGHPRPGSHRRGRQVTEQSEMLTEASPDFPELDREPPPAHPSSLGAGRSRGHGHGMAIPRPRLRGAPAPTGCFRPAQLG